MKKKVIALNALRSNSGWIGGLYYIRNIAYQLSVSKEILSKYKIVIFTYQKNENVFSDLSEGLSVVTVPDKRKGKMWTILYFLLHRVDFAFPIGKGLGKFGFKPIRWIPDFQHNHYPNMFSEEECAERSGIYQKYAQESEPLVLSSEDSKHDLQTFYKCENPNVKVVHFVSYIEPMIRKMNKENETLKKYELDGRKYVCVMNQFWQHKNHLIILDAMKLLFADNADMDLLFVFTGQLEDYRSPEYIEKLKQLFELESIKEHSKMLGFISREDQLVIMKNAEFLIQPSLFEGWGTVVEDAKVLDKTILLSDIPVHREQMTEKCTLFDPRDADSLAKIIREEYHKEHVDDIEHGIDDMKKRAKEYAIAFEALLDNYKEN